MQIITAERRKSGAVWCRILSKHRNDEKIWELLEISPPEQFKRLCYNTAIVSVTFFTQRGL
jgi:hypothetical protein